MYTIITHPHDTTDYNSLIKGRLQWLSRFHNKADFKKNFKSHLTKLIKQLGGEMIVGKHGITITF